MTAGKTYGEYLPDQVERVAKLSEAQLELVNDVRDLYSARSILEKEYATKLHTLAKKAAEKKAKRIASLVVGDEPTRPWGDETLRASTLDYAYTDIIASLDHASQCHMNHSEELCTKVVEATKSLEKKFEDTKKKQTVFYQKLLAEREKVYADRVKTKQKYDDECHDLESYRQKHTKASNDKHATRAAKQIQEQENDVLGRKNIYLLSIAVANKVKTNFYHQDIPMLENQYQEVQRSLLANLIAILQTAQFIHTTHLSALQTRSSVVQKALEQIDTAKDQELFIDHNIQPFSDPLDWDFEPCVGHYDTSEMSTTPGPKVYLQNRLAKSRAELADLMPQMEMKEKEVEQLSKIVTAYSSDASLGNSDEVFNNRLEMEHQLTFLRCDVSRLLASIETITAALKGDEGDQSPHQFVAATFTIPTPCIGCSSTIWGINKQGKTCDACKKSVHYRCELKAPADCTGAKENKKHHKDAIRHSTSTTSLSSSIASSATQDSTSHVAIEQVHDHSFDSHPTARILWEFTPTSPFEIPVAAGSLVIILEEDDGSGWVKVQDQHGARGLVPADYTEIVEDVSSLHPSSESSVLSRSGEFVKGIYVYQAAGPEEIDVTPGCVIELTSGPQSGRDYGGGWWEGYDMNGKKGIFPSNYVEPA